MTQDERTGIVPESVIVRATTRMFRAIHSPLVFNHASRVFYFGTIVADKRGLKVNADLLYVAAMFQKFGLSPLAVGSLHPIEIDGANATTEFLRKFHVAPRDCGEVWDAVALSATPNIAVYKSALARALQYGLETDLLGLNFCEVSLTERQKAVGHFPREAEFADQMINAIGAALKHRSGTAFGTVYADILERTDPNYRRPNLCGKILGSDWATDG